MDASETTTDSTTGVNRILLIQSDLSERSAFDLISCARHVIVEECKAHLTAIKNTLIVLIVNVPRENVSMFSGFQVSYWSCYHVDDLDELPKDMPTFEILKDKNLSKLLDESLASIEANSDVKAANVYIDLKSWLQKCAYAACSFIKDENLTRTLDRIELFINLCSHDDKQFLKFITRRLIELQTQKEKSAIGSRHNWLVNDVAQLQNVKQYSTLRRACQNHLETRISPLLGYLLANIDSYYNLDVFYEAYDYKWKYDLWLSIFNDDQILKFDYENMLSKGDFKEELKQFQCKSQWTFSVLGNDLFLNSSKQQLSNMKPKIPFFWILTSTLKELYDNFMQQHKSLTATNETKSASVASSSPTQLQYEQYKQTITQLFEQTQILKVIDDATTFEKQEETIKVREQFLKEYINDFILFNCKLKSNDDLAIISNAINQVFNEYKIDESDLRLSLPMVHYQYEQIRSKIDIYLKFVQLQPKITETLKVKQQSTMHRDIDIQACIECMKQFKLGLSTNNVNEIRNCTKQLCAILQLVSGLIASNAHNKSDNEKFVGINEEYQSLKAINLLIEDIILPITDRSGQLSSINAAVLCSRFSNVYLQGRVNFKELDTLVKLHNYVLFCIQHARGAFFRWNTQCKSCVKNKETFFQVSECKCYLCSDCIVNMKNKFTKKCLGCQNILGTDTTYASLEELNKKPYLEFEEILNQFYLDIIEYLVFDEQQIGVIVDESKTPINLILKVITESKVSGQQESSCYLQITPQYLPLLIQILFKNYSHEIKTYLGKWFETKALTSKSQEIFQSTLNLALFFINCVHDQLVNINAEKSLIDKLDNANKLIEKEINNSIKTIFEQMSHNFNVDDLCKIAQLKYLIGIMAYVATSSGLTNDANRKYVLTFNQHMRAIVESIPQDTTKTIYYYLLKEIIRKYGSASIRSISNNNEFKWITPQSIIGNDDKTTDRYVVIGAKYTKLKEIVKETISANNSQKLTEHLTQTRDDFMFPHLCLALYQEVSILHRTLATENIPIQIFESVLQAKYANQKALWLPILKNQFTHNLRISKETNIDLASILFQFKMSVLHSKSKLIKPFSELILNPNSVRDAYLPTMPQDFIFDIQQALLEGRGHDNPKFYQCPNGHIYVLFDCGRPWVVLKCKECQADIGGTGHKLLENNKELNIADTTMRGYCLTEATTMSDTPTSERNLNQTSFHLARFFLHCALYLACDKDENVIKNIMVKETPNVKDFFWNHLLKDLYLITKALNLNLDEVYIVIHHILNEMMVQTKAATHDKWTTKPDRQNWEQSFSDYFLQPAFKNSANIITKGTKEMKNDCKDTVGRAELYFMAYELISDQNVNTLCPYEKEQFWKFRPTISFDSMAIELSKETTVPRDHIVLKKLIEMKDRLEIVFFLPDIVKLVNILQKHLSKVIFKEYARKYSLRDCIDSKYLPSNTVREDIERCVKQFDKAWKLSKAQLSTHIKNILPQSQFTFDQDYSFSLDTKVSHYLPSKYGDGLACYGLLHYLSSIHNEFLDHYKASNRASQQQQLDELNLALFENPEFIINFDTKGSLLRIIISNVKYDAKESKCIFSYDKIEKQIVNKYIQTKSKIDMQTIKIFEYSEEMSELSILIKLNEIIKQETIDTYTQKTIFESYEQINETSEALHMLKTIINFATTTSANGDMKLYDFVHLIYVNNEYKNPDSILKSRVTESCQLKHLKHLWIIISLKRAILFTINNQDPFELLEDIFRRNPEGASEHNEIYNGNELNTISMLLVLYQLVIFFIYNIKSDEERNFYPNYSLKDTFLAIDMETTTILFPDNMQPMTISGLFPESIKMSNVYYAWKNLANKIGKQIS